MGLGLDLGSAKASTSGPWVGLCVVGLLLSGCKYPRAVVGSEFRATALQQLQNKPSSGSRPEPPL
nr:hypothetical protein Itr_chr14CG28990 [Ipomoea trifida]